MQNENNTVSLMVFQDEEFIKQQIHPVIHICCGTIILHYECVLLSLANKRLTDSWAGRD